MVSEAPLIIQEGTTVARSPSELLITTASVVEDAEGASAEVSGSVIGLLLVVGPTPSGPSNSSGVVVNQVRGRVLPISRGSGGF